MFECQVFFINYSWSTSVTHDICSNRNPKLGWWLGWWLWVVSSDDISHRVCYLICIPVSRISLGWNRLIGLLLKFSDNTIWLVWKNSKRPKMEIIYLGTPLRRRKNNTPPPTPPANTKTQQPPAPNGQQNIRSEKVSGFGGRKFLANLFESPNIRQNDRNRPKQDKV